jgi:hypothetical protein
MGDDPWSMLRGLFPKWEPTLEESGLFRRAFESRRNDLLTSAIEDYRTFYKYREPNLGEILKRYADLFRQIDRSSEKADESESDIEDQADLDRSRRRIAHDLELASDTDLTRVMEELGKMPSLVSFIGRLSSSRDEWSHVQRGLVWAKAEQMGLLAGSSSSTVPPSPSPGPG